MKKYFLIVIMLACFFMTTKVEAKISLPEKTDHEKVTVYLFRGQGCTHCREFLSYFINKYQKYEDYFEIVAYESWNNEDNKNFLLELKERFNEKEITASVPYIVIGDTYHSPGYRNGEEVIEEALSAYQDDKYTDVVASMIKDEKLNLKKETIKEAAAKEELIKLDENGEIKSKLNDGVVVGIIFGIVVLGFAGLVFFSRK